MSCFKVVSNQLSVVSFSIDGAKFLPTLGHMTSDSRKKCIFFRYEHKKKQPLDCLSPSMIYLCVFMIYLVLSTFQLVYFFACLFQKIDNLYLVLFTPSPSLHLFSFSPSVSQLVYFFALFLKKQTTSTQSFLLDYDVDGLGADLDEPTVIIIIIENYMNTRLARLIECMLNSSLISGER